MAPGCGLSASPSIDGVTLAEMEREASVVFVGMAERVQEKGWLIMITFRDNRFLRGGPSRVVTITSLQLPGIKLRMQAGARYVIFGCHGASVSDGFVASFPWATRRASTAWRQMAPHRTHGTVASTSIDSGTESVSELARW